MVAGRKRQPILPRSLVALGSAYDIRGLSAGELARRSGLHPSYISRMLKGERRPSSDALERMAQALNVSMEALQSELRAVRRRASPPPDTRPPRPHRRKVAAPRAG